MLITPVILSGGAGTRLWPLSTSARPKQFLALAGSQSLFEDTLKRASDGTIFTGPVIIGNGAHDQLMADMAAASGFAHAPIILEPMGRNTAPAIALAAMEAAPDALLLVSPSDHVIKDKAAYLSAVKAASPAAQSGKLVTFGIRPTGPETGYGYIRAGAQLDDATARVDAFIEKPAHEKAQAMIEAGGHYWNAGIFLFRADAYLGAMRTHAPDMLDAVKASHQQAKRKGQYIYPDTALFADCPADSIDYAIMEKADNVAVVPVDCGWSDLGSWDAIYAIAEKDEQDNAISGAIAGVISGDVARQDIKGNLVLASNNARIAIADVSDLIIIANGGDVLVLPRGQSQKVKTLLQKL